MAAVKKPDILDQEVVALAELAIARYGERAGAYAALQVLKARYQRQSRVMEAWQRIVDAIQQIFRAEPSWDERISRFRPQPATDREHHVAPAERTIERLAMRYAPTRDLPALDPTR
jgi:hypothetical protein